MPIGVTQRFVNFNTLQSKDVSLVVSIPGLPFLTNRTIFTRIRYGDPGVEYGAGYVYGGLRIRTDCKDILSLDGSSLTISQRLEPEQGRAAISMLTLAFIDLNQYMSDVIAPGAVLDDIMGKPVTVYLGFEQISFPEDYFVIFRGVITGVSAMSGTITLQISDQNVTRRQNIFYTPKASLVGSIGAGDTSLTVTAAGDFPTMVLSPAITGDSPAYDPAIRLFVKIENEYIEYGPTSTVPLGTFDQTTGVMTGVVRNSPPTDIPPIVTSVAHAAGSELGPTLEIHDRAIAMALKLMLSGWGGDWLSGVPIVNIVATLDTVLGDQAEAIILPTSVDAKRDYGLTLGDFVTITGDPFPENNVTGAIIGFGDLAGDTNRLIYINQPLVRSVATPATLSFRSQYDTYPESSAVKLTPIDVDVPRHQFIESTYFGQYPEYQYRFIINEQETCKTFIENEIFLPIALYSLTRQGQLSVGITKPPLADQNIQFLTSDNVKNPENITVTRGTNNRKFFNEITYEFDADDQGNFASSFRTEDSDSLSIIKIPVTLPISSKGARTSLGFQNIINRNSRFLLSRYKKGAQLISLTTNWQVGSQIESGDVVALIDNGGLQISNLALGGRNVGAQLFEVIDRNLDIKSGDMTTQLVSGIGAAITDRFAVISPSSNVTATTPSTVNTIYIEDSYGALFPGNEKQKWVNYFGQNIMVHSVDWSVVGTTVLIGFDPQNPYKMLVSPNLAFIPQPGYVVDIDKYPNSNDPTADLIYKAIFCFLDPQVTVVSGISTTQLTVSPSDIGKFHEKCPVRIHDMQYVTHDSGDVLVLSVDSGTNTITLTAPLTFVPSTGDLIDLIGFPDFGAASGGPYKFL